MQKLLAIPSLARFFELTKPVIEQIWPNQVHIGKVTADLEVQAAVATGTAAALPAYMTYLLDNGIWDFAFDLCAAVALTAKVTENKAYADMALIMAQKAASRNCVYYEVGLRSHGIFQTIAYLEESFPAHADPLHKMLKHAKILELKPQYMR